MSEKKEENPIMQYFSYEHLLENLQHTSKPFCELARTINWNHIDNMEKSVTLRKLLEAKDAAVRSKLYHTQNSDDTIMSNSPDGSHKI